MRLAPQMAGEKVGLLTALNCEPSAEPIQMMTTALALDKQTQIFPSKGIHGFCLDCGKEVISKCGTIVSHHFAHIVNSDCGKQFHDHKSEWHRAWQLTVQPQIAGKNVEVTISSDKKIKRADLISNSNIIIEFQHSHLPITERQVREVHYKNMIWVVHSDKAQSRTWRNNTTSRIFYNGDDDLVYWYPKNSNLKLTIQKEEFIKYVINNRFFTLKGFDTREKRAIKKHTKENIWYVDNYFLFGINDIKYFTLAYHGSAIMAMIQLAIMNNNLERYFEEQKRIIKITEENKLTEKQKQLNLLIEQANYLSLPRREDFIKRIKDEEEAVSLEEKRNWILKINQDRYYALLKEEQESLNQINNEIINKQNEVFDSQTQELIRIDLIRANGKNKYAAETARERLKHLGVRLNCEKV